MRASLVTLCAMLSLLGLSLSWRQQEKQRQEKHREGEHETELSQRMEKIEKNLKAVRRGLRDESGRGAALAALVETERLTLECKALQPEAASKLPEAERAAMVSAFRRTMVDFLLRQLELEAALLDGNAETMRQTFDRLREMEDPAHERFAPDREDEDEGEDGDDAPR